MLLLDTGELMVIEAHNAMLTSSFDRPTSTLLHAETFCLGVPLRSLAFGNNISPGAYHLVLTPQRCTPPVGHLILAIVGSGFPHLQGSLL